MRQPFGGGDDTPAAPGLAPSYPAGLALGRDGLAIVGRSTDDEGTTRARRAARRRARCEIYRHAESAGVGDLSRGRHAARDRAHRARRRDARRAAGHARSTARRSPNSTTPRGGTEELGLDCLGFAPVAGDPRLLVGHQRRGRWQPMIWDAATGVADRAGDRPARRGRGRVVLRTTLRAAGRAHPPRPQRAVALRPRRPARTAAWCDIPTEPGSIGGATARPDGTVEYLWSSAQLPPQVRSTHRRASCWRRPGSPAPASVPVEDVWVDGPGGPVHALVQRPGRRGPVPDRLRHPRRSRPGTTATRSPRRPPPGWTTASRWCGSTTAVPPATAGSGRTRSSTGSG